MASVAESDSIESTAAGATDAPAPTEGGESSVTTEQTSESSASSETAEETSAEDQAILDRFAKEQGIDLRSKFKTDADFLKGYKEAISTLHRRDEDAAAGKLLRGKEKEFLEFLRGQSANGNGAPKPPPASEKPMTWEEYKLLEAHVLDPATGQARPQARPEDIARYQEVNSTLLRRAFDLSFQPEQILGKTLEQKITEAFQQRDQSYYQQQAIAEEQSAVNSFADENKDWLFANKTNFDAGLTPQGERLDQLVGTLRTHYQSRGQTFPDSVLLKVAYAELLKEQAQAGAGASVPIKSQAKRKASVAHGKETQEELVRRLVDEGKDIPEIQRIVNEQFP